MERGGYTAEDFDTDPVEVWPENWPAAYLFSSLSTQWSIGMGGASGLRYEAVYPLLDRLAQSPEEWTELFDDVRVLEASALKTMSET
jgi:hypothetical protein